MSVEVNGTLVGDSPYLVVFEVDDELVEEAENANFVPVSKVSPAPRLLLIPRGHLCSTRA